MRVPLQLAAGIAAAFAMPAQADCDASTTSARTHLAELYTSEGCSSCPPADRWFGALRTDQRLVPLAYHVDYWDSPAWSDRFADARFAKRQRRFAEQAGKAMVYTPQVVLDGRGWNNWGSGLPTKVAEPDPVAIALHVDPGPALAIRVVATPSTNAGHYAAYAAITEDKLYSRIGGGENAGAGLRHEHVVRGFAGPLALAAATATLTPPADLQRAHAHVVAFVEDTETGVVANAVALALGDCSADAPRPAVR